MSKSIDKIPKQLSGSLVSTLHTTFFSLTGLSALHILEYFSNISIPIKSHYALTMCEIIIIIQYWKKLTFAGLSVAAKTEARSTAAGPSFVPVAKQTDVGAASSFTKLIQLTSVAAH